MREEENAQLIAAMTEAQIPHKLAIFNVMMWLPCEKTRTRGGGRVCNGEELRCHMTLYYYNDNDVDRSN